MDPDFHKDFTNRFNEVCLPVTVTCEGQLKASLESKQFKGMNPGQREVYLSEQFNLLNHQALNSQRKDYLFLAADSSNLCKLFSTNLLFRPREEAICLTQALISYVKRIQLIQLIMQTKGQPYPRFLLEPGKWRAQPELGIPLHTWALTGSFAPQLMLLDQHEIEKVLEIIAFYQTQVDIFCNMIPELEFIEQFIRFMSQSIQDGIQGKCVQLIKKEAEETFSYLFEQVYKHVKDILDITPVEIKYPFISCIQRNWTYQKHRAEIYNQVFAHYYDPLIGLFAEEWRYVERVGLNPRFKLEDILYERQRPKVLKTSKKVQVKKPAAARPLAFYYKEKISGKLKAVLDALVFLGAISRDVTLAQFRALFNGLVGCIPLEWLAGQGDLKAFIKEAMRILGSDFAPKNKHWKIVEKCFVQKGGIAFDAKKLRFSKSTYQEQDYIEAARKFR